MFKYLILFIIVLCPFLNKGQTIFQKTYFGVTPGMGFFPNAVHQTFDGGYIIGGSQNTSVETSNSFLIKTNASGDTLWSKTYGASSGAYSVHQTTDGGFIIAGWALLTTLYWSYDAIAIKTDSMGNMAWYKTYGTTNTLSQVSCRGQYIIQTTDGGYILTGSTDAFGSGSSDVYLVRMDANGSLIWTKTFGGSGSDVGNSVKQTNDGGFIIIGSTSSYGAGYNDIYLIKTDSLGNHLWSKVFGGASSDYGNYLEQTADGGFIITGSSGNFTNDDMMLIKTDSVGTLQWSKTFGDSLQDRGQCVQQTSDGNFIVIGFTQEPSTNDKNTVLIKTNSLGDTIWTRSFYDPFGWNIGNFVCQTNDSGYVLASNILLPMQGGGYAQFPWLIKTDSAGYSGCANTSQNINISNPVLLYSNPPTQQGSGGTSGNTFFSSNNANLKDSIYCVMAGIEENINRVELLHVYPNPSTGKFTLQVRECNGQKSSIIIYNILGEVIYKLTDTEIYQIDIDITNQSKGVYFIKFFRGENFSVQKMIHE